MQEARAQDAPERTGRRVSIDYRVELRYAVRGPSDFVFLIHPARTAQQWVTDERLEVCPSHRSALDFDPVTCNRPLKVRAGTGDLVVRLHARVDIAHVLADPAKIAATAPADLPAPALRYLAASRYCQSDQVLDFAWREFGRIPRGYAQVQAVVDWVRAHTRFQPGSSGPGTSALETLALRAGVCRDFAHLAIALCRALNYPARFATALDFGADPSLGPPDFHAYVEAFLDRWYVFDPTGISPPTGLIRIATGRDAADVSFATMFGPVAAGTPRVAFHAVEAGGFTRPWHTPLAVSTAAI